MSRFEIVPAGRDQALAFVEEHHRHSKRPQGYKFALGALFDGDLVGVAIVGRPVSRMLDDGRTAEITRVCTDGTRNACSFLYGAAVRAARALGYLAVITYTLEAESGASLRASGARRSGETRAESGWSRPGSAHLDRDEGYLPGVRVRWEWRG